MGYLDDLAIFPWADKVHLHITDEKCRLDLGKVFSQCGEGARVYTCGAERYMSAVICSAEHAGVPEENRHLEYFSVPEIPEWENHDFKLKLAKSGRELLIPADKSAGEVLVEQGYSIDLKCSDGLCGVCKCALISGEVEHRDFVLSKKQREQSIILCQSRAAEAGGVVEVDL
jgi:ferredoxin